MKNVLEVGLISLVVMFVIALLNNIAINIEYYAPIGMLLIASLIVLLKQFINDEYVSSKQLLLGLSFIIILIAISFIGKTSIFIAKELSQSLNVKQISSVEITGQRSVTIDMANKIANKVLGEKHNGVQISSQYEINLEHASVQMVNNELVWVLPLDYSGFFKWMEQDSIPGYVLVSATEPNRQAKLVLDYKIKVSSNAYLMDQIDRIIYLKSGLRNVDTHFEIDDNGKPYYISTVQVPHTFYKNFQTTEIFITDAQTVEIKKFNTVEEAIEHFPWIDRMVSESAIEDRLNYYGSLQNGWFNSIFSQTNVNKVTKYKYQELWLVNVGDVVHYFTGITSVNAKDQSLVSGILINAITGEAMEINLSGVMDEDGAVSVLDSGLGADSIRWEPVLPMPFFINGEFYWGSSIVSDGGIFQKIGIVKGNDQSKVFYAKTFEEAIEKAKNGNLKSSIDTDEMILVNKKILNEILEKITELEKLKTQLQ